MLLAGVVSLSSAASEAAVAAPTFIWGKPAPVSGVTGTYNSVIVPPTGGLQLVNNTKGTSSPGLVLHRISGWSTAFKPYAVLIPNNVINDVYLNGKLALDRKITRSAVRCVSGLNTCYGLVSVSAGYPPADGRVVPAFVSAPTIAGPWTYHGKMQGEPKALYDAYRVWNSTLALQLNPGGPATPDRLDPAGNRFVTYVDAFAGRGLALAYSADGVTWKFHRDAAGRIIDLRPPEVRAVDQTLIFPSVVKTPSGDWHMFATANWPPVNIHHLWSRDGVSWELVGGDAKKPGAVWRAPYSKTAVPFWEPSLRQVCVLTQRDSRFGRQYRMCITGQQ